jgi:hypothetical protein
VALEYLILDSDFWILDSSLCLTTTQPKQRVIAGSTLFV